MSLQPWSQSKFVHTTLETHVHTYTLTGFNTKLRMTALKLSELVMNSLLAQSNVKHSEPVNKKTKTNRF